MIYTPFTQEPGINVEVTDIVGTQMPTQIKQGHPQLDLINSMTELITYVDQDGLEKLDRIRDPVRPERPV